MTPCLNPACNAPNVPNAKFCMKCGTKLLIQDCYRPIKALGEGSFGKTFLAADQGKPSQPQCVIKQFTFTSANPNFVQKAKDLFYQEAKQLEKLGKHPQIPALFSYHEQENRLYLIQEFIDGETLADELAQSEAFSEAKVRQVLADLLPVLQFLHEHQVIHRDIKPENIMRRRSDQKLVLIDFGAVKQTTATSLQRTGTSIGSPAYQAPEQGIGKAVFSSDLYSLGVSCLQLLTNMEPYDLYDVLEGEFVWRHYLLKKTVEDNLGRVLDKMTQGAIKQRYKSAQEVLQALNPPTPNVPVLPVQPQTTPPLPKSSSTQSFLGNLFSSPSQAATPIIQTSGKNFIENLGGRISLEMIALGGGTFSMGSNENVWEQPIHLVKVPAFSMGKYPITQEQYQAVMEKNPSHFKGFKGAKNPVEQVSWNNAVEFCRKLSQQTGNNYRLPSEAEWEYACRAGSEKKYCFGDNETLLRDYAWYDKNSGDTTHPVGEKKPNAFGLYDMHGNVWELCLDTWHGNYNNAPIDGGAWIDIDTKSHILRGGSWIDAPEYSRSAYRSVNYLVNHNFNIGFRVSSFAPGLS
jgi:formylglycine-generating enzyme required for sulfatase activity